MHVHVYSICESVNCMNGMISNAIQLNEFLSHCIVRIIAVQYQLLIVFNCDKHVFRYYYTADTINTV